MKRGYAEYEPLSSPSRVRSRLGRSPFRTAHLNLAGWSALVGLCLVTGLIGWYAVTRLGGPAWVRWVPWVAGLVPLVVVKLVDLRRHRVLRQRPGMARVTIRPSRDADLIRLGAIEKSGDAAFRTLGMDLVADSPTPEVADFEGAHAAGWLFVAVDESDQPIGFVRVEFVDGNPHVEQVSVLPEHAGRHTGALLLSHVAERVQDLGFMQLTLRTFVDVPWNGPYYARLGWRVLPESEWGAGLRALAECERALGLDRWPRQAMALTLDPTRGSAI